MKSRTRQSNGTQSMSSHGCTNNGGYPAINAQYWLPSSNATPYLVPG